MLRFFTSNKMPYSGPEFSGDSQGPAIPSLQVSGRIPKASMKNELSLNSRKKFCPLKKH